MGTVSVGDVIDPGSGVKVHDLLCQVQASEVFFKIKYFIFWIL